MICTIARFTSRLAFTFFYGMCTPAGKTTHQFFAHNLQRICFQFEAVLDIGARSGGKLVSEWDSTEKT